MELKYKSIYSNLNISGLTWRCLGIPPSWSQCSWNLLRCAGSPTRERISARVFSEVGIHFEMSRHCDTISHVATARDILSLRSSRDLPFVSKKNVAILSVCTVTSAPFQSGPQMRTEMTWASNSKSAIHRSLSSGGTVVEMYWWFLWLYAPIPGLPS